MSRDLVPITIAYVIAIAGAVLSLMFLEGDILWNTLWADLVATVIIFVFSRVYKNSSFYDAYWSVIPPLIVVYWAVYHISPNVEPARQAMVIILVWLWGIRLTANWASHWDGMHHEDWRYGPIKEKAGKFNLLADFGGIHLFPTLIVFASCLPLYAAVCIGEAPLNWLDVIAFVVTLGAILIEMVSDIQLHAFVANKKPGEIMQTGLWRYSRHPNYFGNACIWWGFSMIAVAAGAWWAPVSAVLMTFLLLRVSGVAMLERSIHKRRPDYEAYKQRTSAFVPRPPRG